MERDPGFDGALKHTDSRGVEHREPFVRELDEEDDEIEVFPFWEALHLIIEDDAAFRRVMHDEDMYVCGWESDEMVHIIATIDNEGMYTPYTFPADDVFADDWYRVG
jgi:hypothetical protein